MPFCHEAAQIVLRFRLIEFIIVLALLANQNYGHEHYSDELEEYCTLEHVGFNAIQRYPKQVLRDCGAYCPKIWSILSPIVECIVPSCGVYCPQLWSILFAVVEYIVPSCGVYCCQLWRILSPFKHIVGNNTKC